MEDANQSKAMAELSHELWCQLVFLNVHRGQSRTLNKTKVCKINISDWDLIPVEADEPVRVSIMDFSIFPDFYLPVEV